MGVFASMLIALPALPAHFARDATLAPRGAGVERVHEKALDDHDGAAASAEDKSGGPEETQELLPGGHGGDGDAGTTNECTGGISDDDDLAQQPQASSRKLAQHELQDGLGLFGFFPPELYELVWSHCHPHDLTVAARASRALNERVLPVLMRKVEVTPTKGCERLCDVVDRLYRLELLDVRSLVVHERDAALPTRVVNTAIVQMASTLQSLVWKGGWNSSIPCLPALPQMTYLELEWEGRLHLWDKEDGAVFEHLLADGTVNLEMVRIKADETALGVTLVNEGGPNDTHSLSLERVFTTQPRLESLSVEHLHGWALDGETRLVFPEVGTVRSQLLSLYLRGSSFRFGQRGLHRFAAIAPRLEDLSILSGWRISSDDLNLLPRMPTLTHLAASLHDFLRLAPVLVTPGQLNVATVASPILFPAGELLSVLDHRPRVFDLDLELAPPVRFDQALQAILRHYPEIEGIALTITLARQGRRPLPATYWITALRDLAQTAPRLRFLHLAVPREEITPPLAINARWAEELFQTLPPRLEHFSVAGDIVKNAGTGRNDGLPPIGMEFRVERGLSDAQRPHRFIPLASYG